MSDAPGNGKNCLKDQAIFVKRILVAWMAILLFFFTAGSFAQPHEKIRAGYGGAMRESLFKKLQANGFNAYMLKVSRPGPVTAGKVKWENDRLVAQYDEGVIQKIVQAADWARQYDIKLFICTDYCQYTVQAMEQLGPYNKAASSGPRNYTPRGITGAPGPDEEKYWNGILQEEAVCIAKISRDHPGITAFLMDVEMYPTWVTWGEDVSFDDKNFYAFRDQIASRQTVPELSIGQRLEWLKKNGLLSSYYDFLTDRIYKRAKRLGQAVYKENPDLTLGVFPFGVNWFYRGFTKGLAEGTKKDVWLFPEAEYILGYTAETEATFSNLKRSGLGFRYVGGLWIGRHDPFALAWHAGRLSENTDGYWLFTTTSLIGDSKDHTGPYALAEGATQDQYWQALQSVNLLIGSNNLCPSRYKLVTPNAWAKDMSQSKVSCRYSPFPAYPITEESRCRALFDGSVSGIMGTETAIAWSLSPEEIGNTFSVTIDLAEEHILNRIALSAPIGGYANLWVVGKVTVKMQYYAAGQWNNLPQAGPVVLSQQQESFFAVDTILKKPIKTDKILITLQPDITKDVAQALIQRWDGLFVVLSEVAVWSE